MTFGVAFVEPGSFNRDSRSNEAFGHDKGVVCCEWGTEVT